MKYSLVLKILLLLYFCVSISAYAHAQGFDLRSATRGWQSYRENLKRGFECDLVEIYETSSSGENGWTRISRKEGKIAIGTEGELYIESSNVRLMNTHYFSEMRRINDNFFMETCNPRSDYNFSKGFPVHRFVLRVFDCVKIETLPIEDFFQSERVSILASNWSEKEGHSELHLTVECDDFGLDDFNQLSGRGTVSLLPDNGWVIKGYRLPLKSILNLKEFRSGIGVEKKWSEVCWAIRSHEYDLNNVNPVLKEQSMTYQPTKPDVWRRHLEEFSNHGRVTDNKRFYARFYGLPEPPFGRHSEKRIVFWTVIGLISVLVAALLVKRTFK